MINSLQLENFTCFTNAKFEFSKGINVLIGENGTGKTHVLKCLGVFEMLNTEVEEKEFQKKFRPYFFRFFKAETVSALAKLKTDFFSIQFEKNKDITKLLVEPKMPQWDFKFDIDLPTHNHAVFIPAKEVLSFYPGFVASYEKRELNFDATYHLLCKALSLNPLKEDSEQGKTAKAFIAELEDVLGATVVKKDDHFYLQFADNQTPTEINMVAEGWRKMATLMYLVLNGEIELNDKMTLLIDEPEANLNPKLIEAMAKFLIKLASRGVQVFIATHSHLLVNYLSLFATHEPENPETKFFSLYKENNEIEIETADSIDAIQHNPMLDENVRFYDKEMAYFSKKLNPKN